MTRTSTKNRARSRAKRGMPSIVQRADGRWSLTVELPRSQDGERRRHQGTYRTYAEAVEAARLIDYSARTLSRADAGLTVEQLLDRWSGVQMLGESSTMEHRAWIAATVKRYLGAMQVRQLKKSDIEAFKKAMIQAGRAPSTVNKCLRCLRGALALAVDAELIQVNPAQAVKAVREPAGRRVVAWTDEQVRTILEASRTSPLGMLFLVGFVTGARLGELVGARLEDYDQATGTLHITGTAKKAGGRGQPKTATAFRKLPLTETVQQRMQEHLLEVRKRKELAGGWWGKKKEVSEQTRQKQREAALARSGRPLGENWRPLAQPGENYEPLFPTSHGTPWGLRNAQSEWARLLQTAGLPHVRFHDVRAYFATSAFQAGAPVQDVQDVLGHSSPVMSLRYARSVAGSELRVIALVAERLQPPA